MNIVILGGGTAGWLTALFMKKVLPESNVTLVQNPEIGTIGVGEATTPNFVEFLQELDINPLLFVKETNGTIKNGISFENWNGDGKKYAHTFDDKLTQIGLKNIFPFQADNFYLKNLVHNNLPFDEYHYSTKLMYDNRVDITRHYFALHFDASLLAKYLQDIGISRNINLINGNYTTPNLSDTGYINSINLESGETIPVDFIFDSSGFSRVLMNGIYNEEWISYSKYLPMKKGIPFWLKNKETIPPYTKSIAMKYGWMWEIPLQHRTGAGYIFDSDFISVDEAKAEAEEYHGISLDIRKIIPFEPGRYKNLWVKNCMSIGLCSSFIEPLESTSLMLTIFQLQIFKNYLNEIVDRNERSIKKFNELNSKYFEDTLNFVYLHYMTKRNDSEFWRTFKEKNKMPPSLEDVIDDIKCGNIRHYDFSHGFTVRSYYQVAKGLELFENLCSTYGHENTIPSPEQYKNIIEFAYKDSIDHKQFLKLL